MAAQKVISGGSITLSEEGKKLTISDVQLSQSGLYEIVAENEAGTDVTTLRLDVIGKLVISWKILRTGNYLFDIALWFL